jgi:hypothetical protein
MIPIIIAVVVLVQQRRAPTHTPAPPPTAATPISASGASEIQNAFRDRRSDLWVEASGVVVKLLPDDRDGEPHQKLLVRIDDADDLTVLIAHNLNAAQRVPVHEGDHLRFRGEYEWTDKGGTVHFTHAPEQQRREPGGWIDFNGDRFE